jgi:hypothetical protein
MGGTGLSVALMVVAFLVCFLFPVYLLSTIFGV